MESSKTPLGGAAVGGAAADGGGFPGGASSAVGGGGAGAVLTGDGEERRTFYRDAAAAASKFDALCSGGTALLHVIIDWDRTCTTYFRNGKKGATCHGVVEARRSPELLAKAHALNARYLPIEVDPVMSREEKVPHMRAWYAAVNSLLAASGMTRADLREDVRAADLGLREGVGALLRASLTHKFPVTILSAGIGDVIEEALAQLFGPLPTHIRIVSNYMVWEGDTCVGFSEPVIHMFNKTSAFAFSEEEQRQLSVSRPNVLVIGDSDGDATMADGLDAKVLVKIGILNDAVAIEKALPRYLQLFDVVITEDPPLWPLLSTLRRMGVDTMLAEKNN